MNTLGTLQYQELYDYLTTNLNNGNIIKHETNMKCPMGSNIVVYEDKLTNTLTEHWPMTGSYFVDITEQRFTDIKNGTYVPKFTL
jgi:hypothetical protein